MGQNARSNIADDQPGIPLHLDFQVIDVNTCKPISGIYFDLWSK